MQPNRRSKSIRSDRPARRRRCRWCRRTPAARRRGRCRGRRRRRSRRRPSSGRPRAGRWRGCRSRSSAAAATRAPVAGSITRSSSWIASVTRSGGRSAGSGGDPRGGDHEQRGRSPPRPRATGDRGREPDPARHVEDSIAPRAYRGYLERHGSPCLDPAARPRRDLGRELPADQDRPARPLAGRWSPSRASRLPPSSSSALAASRRARSVASAAAPAGWSRSRRPRSPAPFVLHRRRRARRSRARSPGSWSPRHRCSRPCWRSGSTPTSAPRALRLDGVLLGVRRGRAAARRRPGRLRRPAARRARRAARRARRTPIGALLRQAPARRTARRSASPPGCLVAGAALLVPAAVIGFPNSTLRDSDRSPRSRCSASSAPESPSRSSTG